MSIDHEFPQAWKEGLYQAILRRRDMRHFLPDPIPQETLARVLSAAHHAGSVGFMQPWNFIVIEDRALREKIHAHVNAERLRAAEKFDVERKEKYLSLKLEGILEAPLNVCITCDHTRFGPAVLGRNTIPETDVHSTCCAIQNLWLAARAEGIGVGWVSILQPEWLRNILGIPANVLPVGYLCMGRVSSFPDQPTLEKEGWLPKMPLEEVVFSDNWGRRTDSGLMAALQRESVERWLGECAHE